MSFGAPHAVRWHCAYGALFNHLGKIAFAVSHDERPALCDLELRRVERVAGVHVARLEPTTKPAHALSG